MCFKTFFLLSFFAISNLVFPQDKLVSVEYAQALGQTRDTIYPIAKKLKNIKYILLANQNESKFEQIKIDNNRFGTNWNYVVRAGANGVYYKNLDTQENLVKEEFLGEKFIICHEFKDENWQITTESKTIQGFLCYKALNVEEFFSPDHNESFDIITTAWFCPEINYPFGPRGIDGLPGLVLEASIMNETHFFIAEKIKFIDSSSEKFKVLKPNKGKKISNEEYIKYMKEKMGN